MRTSACNQLKGTVLAIHEGPVNAEVVLALNAEDRLVALITRESVGHMDLRPGTNAFALIKSSFVILGTADEGFNTTARNRLAGTLRRIVRGPVEAEVELALDGGNALVASVTTESVDALALSEGMRACALIKASNVILGVP